MMKMKRDVFLMITLVFMFSLRAHAVESDYYLPSQALDGSKQSAIISMFEAMDGWSVAVERYLKTRKEDRNSEPPSSQEEVKEWMGRMKRRTRAVVDLSRRYRALTEGFDAMQTSFRPVDEAEMKLRTLWVRQLEGARALVDVLVDQFDGEQRLEMSILRYSLASLTQESVEHESLYRMTLQVEEELGKARSRLAAFRSVLKQDVSSIRIRLSRF